MGEWSPECSRVAWLDGGDGARVGARFKGHNRKGWRRWSTTGRIIAAERGRELAFDISALGLPVARWAYRMEAGDGGCRVDESFVDQRGRLMTFLGVLATGVTDRAARNRETMTATLAQLKRAAEAPSREA
jgi:hypothetical protein